MSNPDSKTVRKKIKKVQTLFNVLLLALILVYAVSAYMDAAIPLKYQVVLLLIVIVIAFVGILIKNSFVKVLLVLVLILASFAHLFVQDQIRVLINEDERNSLQQKENMIQKISLVVLKEHQGWTRRDLKSKIFGESAQFDLDTKTFVHTNVSTYISDVPEISIIDDNQQLASQLLDSSIDVMVLDEKNRAEIIEQFPDFEKETVVLTEFTRDKSVKAITANPLKDSFVFYLSGNDSFGSIGDLSRSDVNILMIFNPHIDKVLLVSIPRDSYVSVPCAYGELDKFTHTGNFGVNCQIETIENMLDVKINYYVRINFSSVTRIIDIMGDGLKLYNPYGFEGAGEEYYFSKGCLHLSSGQVLNYLRTRETLPDGDTGRQEHQKIVLNAMIQKAIDPSILFRVGEIIKTAADNIDTNVDADFINKFINRQLDSNPKWKVHTVSFEGEYSFQPTYSMGDVPLSVFEIYPSSLNSVSETIQQFYQAKSADEIDILKQPDVPANQTQPEIKDETSQPSESEPEVTPPSTELVESDNTIQEDEGINYTDAPIIYPIEGGENSCNIK